MKIPGWYKLELLGWVFTGLPLYVATAMYAGRAWPIPDPPSPDLSIGMWLFGFLLFYHPVILAPVALGSMFVRARKTNAQD